MSIIKLAKYKDIWVCSFAHELGQLAQGIWDSAGTNTIKFIPKHKVPNGKIVTNGRIVIDYWLQKPEAYQTRLTLGGDKIPYTWEVTTPTTNLTTAKILFNAIMSTPGTNFFGTDNKNFHLHTPLEQCKYMKLPMDLLPTKIICKYNLKEMVVNGWVYIEIQKVLYGLPQTGLLANKLHTKCLLTKGFFYPCQFTPGLWRLVWWPILFMLAFGDYGIKYNGLQHEKYFLDAFHEHDEISMDWGGLSFVVYTSNGIKKMVSWPHHAAIHPKGAHQIPAPTPIMLIASPHTNTPQFYMATIPQQNLMIPRHLSFHNQSNKSKKLLKTLFYFSMQSTLSWNVP